MCAQSVNVSLNNLAWADYWLVSIRNYLRLTCQPATFTGEILKPLVCSPRRLLRFRARNGGKSTRGKFVYG